MKYSWIAGVVGLILTFLVTGYSLHQHRQATIDAAVDKLTETLGEVKTEWARTVSGLDQMLTGLHHYLELAEQIPDPDLSALRRTMDSLVLNNHYVVSLVVTDFTGQVQHWTNSGPKPNLRDRDYFNIHTSSLIEGITISNPLPSIMSPGQWVFGVSKAVRHPDGTLDKVLIAILDTSRLFRLVETLLRDQDYSLTVLSHSGNIITHIPDHHGMVGKHHPELLRIPESGDKQDDRSAIVTIDGYKHLLLIHHLDCCQLYVRGQIPLAVALAPWKKDALLTVAAGGTIVLILLWQIICLLLLHKQEGELLTEVDSASRHDPLTGLPLLLLTDNNGLENLEDLSATTLILIGPDCFPDILVSCGEQAGDTLIAHYAHILKKLVPHNTRLYRAAGSSFCLLLPETDQQLALLAAEKLRKSLAAEPFDYDGNKTILTSSAGVTLWSGHKSEFSTSLQRGDAALTTARKRGGNQVHWLASREAWLERKQT